ncbi:MAG: DUF4900 domain-containing protein [Candidatus Omnitrophota bacterium]
MNKKNTKGTVLIVSLMAVTVLLILGAMFIVRAISEKAASDRERMLTQAFYLADGGSQVGINQMDVLINTNLMATVNNTNPQVIANDAAGYVASGDGLGFLIQYARDGGAAQFILNGAQARYTGSVIAAGSGTYQHSIIVTEKGNPIAVTPEQWDFPYYYRIETTGTVGGVVRKIALTGDFTVRVQRDNFARFALFTDHHSLPSGGTVWFTSRTNFSGPLHTNERYSFAFNPSGTFDGMVTQHHNSARFHNGGSSILSDADQNASIDVPVFNSDYERGVSEVNLESSVQQQDLIDQARGTDTTPGNGIFVANNGSNLIGGIFVRGDCNVNMSVNGSGNAVYTITQGATTKIVTVDISGNQTTVQTVAGPIQTFSGLPDGVDDVGTILYVDGAISSLGGTVQRDTKLTVASQNDVILTNHVMYEDYTPAVGTPGTPGYVAPHADDTNNMLGIVSWGGDVRIGTVAPDDINIHGSVMARNGVLTVDNYDDTAVGSRGVTTLLGGSITQFYGAFGQFNSVTEQQISGYGRNFVYDNRMSLGAAPPYFPSMRTFIAFTNDLTDKITWQEGGF